MSEPIIIVVDGGVIQNIENIPPGVTIEVHDYDTEGFDTSAFDEDRLQEDDCGDEYILSVYSGKEVPA